MHSDHADFNVGNVNQFWFPQYFLSIGNQQNASYCFISLANLFCCYLSMALIFIPKITFIRQHAHDPREKEDDEKENAEQERKYRELLKINEDLQKKVAEVSRACDEEKKKKSEYVLHNAYVFEQLQSAENVGNSKIPC